jgi:hypothetical protein
MEKFTHGIMVINPNEPPEEDNYSVVHFVGYWHEPTDVDANHLREELRVDPEFELRDIVDELVMYPATKDCLKYYNDMGEIDGIFDKNFPKEKLN